MNQEPRIVIAVTGASGSIYANELLLKCLRNNLRTYLIFTPTAVKVLRTEIPDSLLSALASLKQKMRFQDLESLHPIALKSDLTPLQLEKLKIFDHDDFYAPVASGSLGATHMCLIPASMGSIARVAHGMSSNLIERCADVMMKEARPLVVVPRESPLNSIHLRNLTLLAESGVRVVPAMPAFYFQPKSISDLVAFMVERVIQALGIESLTSQNKLAWNENRL